MKISQLLDGIHIVLTNQESEFINSHQDKIRLTGLSEQEVWIAQNLVRKGVYSISNNNILVKKLDESQYKFNLSTSV